MTRGDARPWNWRATCALYVSPLVWALHHQVGSNVAFAACERRPHLLAIWLGIVAIGVIAASGVVAWRAWRQAGGSTREDAEPLGIFFPLLSVMTAVLFALTIAVQLIADVLLPPCFR
jgi:hypothetical protein